MAAGKPLIDEMLRIPAGRGNMSQVAATPALGDRDVLADLAVIEGRA